ncbi:MAG: hypothetical protein GF411_06880 [Candidatus Lokiarchaeota archaeon]|nr:hypothetical protein [Candidatus Lokiarchaeota archaeon]
MVIIIILLFTSTHCTWCEVVRGMIEEQLSELNLNIVLYEINIDENMNIAQVYGILEVPTVISRTKRLSGLPSFADLRSLLFQSIMGRIQEHNFSIILSQPKSSDRSPESKESVLEHIPT